MKLPDSAGREVGERRHHVIAATTRYEIEGLDLDREKADKNLGRLAGAFESLGVPMFAMEGDEGRGTWRENLNGEQLRLLARAAANSSDWLVVVYTGHGEKLEGGEYRLIMPDCTHDTMVTRRLLPSELQEAVRVEDLPEDRQPHVLLIIDACFAGAAAPDLGMRALLGVGNPHVHVITSVSRIGWATAWEFTGWLGETLSPPQYGRHLSLGHANEWVNLEELAERANWLPDVVGRYNEGRSQDRQAEYWAPLRQTGMPRFFRNPGYVPHLAGQTAQSQKWWAKARGIHGLGDDLGALYLAGVTGRRRAIDALAGWISGEGPGLLVVTGSPGSGKSALLSLPVLLRGMPQPNRDALIAGAADTSLVAYAAEHLTQDVEHFNAIQVGGLTTEQVADQVAVWLGVPPDTSGKDSVARLKAHLGSVNIDPAWLILDGIDEAREGRGVLSLAREVAATGRVRVAVGTRPWMLDGATVDSPETVNLDREGDRDPEALVDYARQVLQADQEPAARTEFRGRGAADKAAAAAQRIAAWSTTAKGEESFLLAGSIAHSFRRFKWDPQASPWSDDSPDAATLFDTNLDAISEERWSARYLLEALAWAKGPGLPRPGVWLTIARCLAAFQGVPPAKIAETGAHGDLSDDDHVDDIQYVIENVGGYIIEDLDTAGRSVYRPFHDLLSAYLQQRPPDAQLDTDETWHARKAAINAAITEALVDLVPGTDVKEWQRAPLYLRTYLAQHAADAGPATLADIAEDMDFLAVADATVLTPLLSPLAEDPRVADVGRVYRRARHRLGADPLTNALRLTEAHLEIRGTPADSRMPLPYQPLINAPTLREDSVLTLTGHSGLVLAVASVRLDDGRVLLASGSTDATVRLWDPNTGEQVGESFTGHTGWVWAVASVRLDDGRVLLASGSTDHTVRLWDPNTGEQAAEAFTGHTGTVRAVASVRLDGGRVLLASGGADATVRLWDPNTGEQVGEAFTGHTGTVRAVASVRLDGGRVLLASGGADATVRLWDPNTGEQVGEAFTGHTGTVPAVASVRLDGGRVLLASGGADATVRLWDPNTGEQVGEAFTGHTGTVRAVASVRLDGGRVLLASGGADATVRSWDPNTGEQVGEAFTGHAGTVPAVASVRLDDGRVLLASGGDDATVRLWGLNTGEQVGESWTGHPGLVLAVASARLDDGRVLLASGGTDNIVRLWDPNTGEQVGEPFTGHTGWVWAVASVRLDGGRVLLASGSTDHTVRLWDPNTGEQVGEAFTGHTGTVPAVASVRLDGGRVLLASGGDDATVRLWDPNSGEQVGGSFTGHSGWVWAVASVRLDGGRVLLASGGDDATVRLWDPNSGEQVGESFTGHSGCVWAVASVRLDGGRVLLASGGDDATVRLWDPNTGEQVGESFTGHTGTVRAVASVRLDGGRVLLASGGDDATVRLWDPNTGEQVGESFTGHTGTVRAVASVRLDGGRVLLASGGDDRLLVVSLALDHSLNVALPHCLAQT